MSSILIAFDPSLYRIAYAVIDMETEEVLRTCKSDIDHLKKKVTGPSTLWVYWFLQAIKSEILDQHKRANNDILYTVVEDAPRASRGFKTAQALIASRVVIECAAIESGVLLLDRVSPDDWFFSVVVEKSIGRVASEDRKKLARDYVASRHPDFKDVTQDEIDAICIGIGAIRREKGNEQAG